MYLIPTLHRSCPHPMSSVKYQTDTSYLVVDNRAFFIYKTETKAVSYASESNKPYSMHGNDLISNTNKTVLIFKDNQIYHFFVDFILPVMDILKENPSDHEFIIMAYGLPYDDTYTKFLEFLLKILSSYGAPYKVIKCKEGVDHCSIHPISNFRILRPHDQTSEFEYYTLKDLNTSVNTIRELVVGSKPRASAKKFVYVNRSRSQARYINSEVDSLAPIRVSSDIEDEIEAILKNNDVEIVNPEVDFTSLAEQINYFSDACAVIAPSGSGLTNMLFMPDGCLVVELSTEIEKPGVDSSSINYRDRVSWYSSLAYAKHHTYLAIELTEDVSQVLLALNAALPLIDYTKSKYN